ncbi:MAG TPA: sigma-70 family RNA polymerase sigma factor [Caldimonas sp.]|jgi:RNA polymerase sigma factor (sigma-70 family)|nr:sigma-70 family RNA polymerase sigma factor [Caldimonas sp.]HEX4235813.1 sigma-70 family RNA polymerase sigma factor [Caldimonas sp.]
MVADTAPPAALADQDRAIAAAFARESRRLRGFVRRRIADACEVDDIVQEAFAELIEATRIATPIEHVGAWLVRVAGRRIIDRFRRTRTLSLNDAGDDDDAPSLAALLHSPAAGPERRYEERRLMATVEAALAELPSAQREVFIAHELEGRSFRQLAEETGVAINTLLARKRYAVLHLRKRLRDLHENRTLIEEETT